MKIKKLLLVGAVAGSLFTAVNSAPAQTTNVTLNIAPAGDQFLLYWPSAATSYVLQSTTNLTAIWAIVTNALPATFSNAVPMTAFTVTNTGFACFYRLYDTNPAGMVLIPAGPFTMGDALDGEADAIPTLVVTVSGFYMDTNLVAYSFWQTVYDWGRKHGYRFDNPGEGAGTNYPVQMVVWNDAVLWCNARSQREGLTAVYYTDDGFTNVYTDDNVNNGVQNPTVNWAANGYRLPTEAEWEKAARGGLSGQRFPWGNTISESQANYYGDTSYSYDLGPSGFNPIGYGTSPVGSFAPNGYGLFDMAGNVFEWCWDWFGTPYAGGTDPRGPDSGAYRILRGGAWDHSGYYYPRCAVRGSTYPLWTFNFIGFRCVRVL